jgi:prepilin-type processing-associated H-X9-DG protein
MRLRRAIVVAALAALPVWLWAARADAQALVDQVRGDAIGYAGWAGADALGPRYDQSHLKAVLEASSMPQFLDDFVPRMIERSQRGQPQAQEAADLAEIAAQLWRKPWAVGWSGMDLDAPGGARPRTVFVCRAGKDAEALSQKIDRLFKSAPGAQRDPRFVTVFHRGDVAGFFVGYESVEAATAAAANQSLAANAGFKSAMSKAGKEPAFVYYVDGKGFVGHLGQYMARGGGPRGAAAWERVREAAGLNGFQRLVLTMGFEGADWGSHLYVEAPAPRKGLMAMVDAAPLSDDVLKTIPATATVAGVSRFDAAALVDGVREIAAAADPQAAEQFDQVVGQANIMMGMDVRKDFLGAFGDEWAYYTDPMTGGRGGMGFVLVNRLRDPAKAQRALARVVQVVNQVVSKQPGNEVKIALRQGKSGDVTVNYAGVPFVTPAWAIQRGNLYFGMYPQVVASAARQGAAGKASILDNKDFVAVRQRLLAQAGGARASSVGFMDLQKTAPGGYQTWLLLSSFARFGDMFGVQSPAMPFPTLDVLVQHLAPAGSVTWSDDAGFHYRGVGPFPLASLFAADTGGSIDPGSTAMVVSILLPALNRAREQANRVASANHLRMIGSAVQMHANDHKGRLPDDMGELLKYDVPPTAFGNPRNKGVTPPIGASPEQLARWVGTSSEYVYRGKGRNYTIGSNEVLAYEKPEGLTDGINILFGDGHVEFVAMPAAQEMIRTGRKPGRTIPGGQ